MFLPRRIWAGTDKVQAEKKNRRTKQTNKQTNNSSGSSRFCFTMLLFVCLFYLPAQASMDAVFSAPAAALAACSNNRTTTTSLFDHHLITICTHTQRRTRAAYTKSSISARLCPKIETPRILAASVIHCLMLSDVRFALMCSDAGTSASSIVREPCRVSF